MPKPRANGKGTNFVSTLVTMAMSMCSNYVGHWHFFNSINASKRKGSCKI